MILCSVVFALWGALKVKLWFLCLQSEHSTNRTVSSAWKFFWFFHPYLGLSHIHSSSRVCSQNHNGNRYSWGTRDDFHLARAVNAHVYVMSYIHSPHRQDIPITYTNRSKLLKDSLTGKSLWFLLNYFSWFLRCRRVEGYLDFRGKLCQHGCRLPLKGWAYCGQVLTSSCRFVNLW